MEKKQFIQKWERQEMNGTWFYLLKWHFIYVLLLLPIAILINNYGILQTADSFTEFVANIDLAGNLYLTHGFLNGIAMSASFLRWKILESMYYRLKVKEVNEVNN